MFAILINFFRFPFSSALIADVGEEIQERKLSKKKWRIWRELATTSTNPNIYRSLWNAPLPGLCTSALANHAQILPFMLLLLSVDHDDYVVFVSFGG